MIAMGLEDTIADALRAAPEVLTVTHSCGGVSVYLREGAGGPDCAFEASRDGVRVYGSAPIRLVRMVRQVAEHHTPGAGRLHGYRSAAQ